MTTDEDNESELSGLTVQLGSPLRDDMYLTYGLEIYADDVSSKRNETDSTTGVTSAARSRFPDDSEMDSLAIYLFDEWRATPALTLGAGVRYSVFDIKLPDADEGQDVDLEPDDLAGDLHVSYQYSPSLQLVGNIGRGFRAPNIFDLGTLGARPGNRFNVASGDLDPESVVSVDLGFKLAQRTLECRGVRVLLGLR